MGENGETFSSQRNYSQRTPYPNSNNNNRRNVSYVQQLNDLPSSRNTEPLQLDYFEKMVADFKSQLSLPARTFLQEWKYIQDYSEKNKLSFWWTLKHTLKAFYQTGCAKWTFLWGYPWFVELREVYIDSLCISICPLWFISSFGVATLVSKLKENNLIKVILRAKSIEGGEEEEGTGRGGTGTGGGRTSRTEVEEKGVVFHYILRMLLNLGIPLLFLYYLPKHFLENGSGSGSGSGSGAQLSAGHSSFLNSSSSAIPASIVDSSISSSSSSYSLLQSLRDSSSFKSIITITVSIVGLIQGITSSLRFKQKIEFSNKNTSIVLSKEKSEVLRQILPLSPVPIKESTVHTGVSMLPLLSRALVIYSHLYPLMKGGILTNTSLSVIGFLSWIAFKHSYDS